ncbi:MAG: ABC transporter substrate-binding protein [Thermomicrobium sp.]|nr:ABC transporter substrate-binding protein [Thermomicrobium sp.]
MRVSRRHFLVTAVAFGASALLAACARGEATPTPAPQPTPTTAPAGQQPAATPTRAAAPAASPTVVSTQPTKTLRFGCAVSLSGVFAAGADVTIVACYKLWQKEVNEAGGIQLSDGRYMVDIIWADDQSNPEECIRQTQRLITQEKVDLLIPPYSTGINHAVAPIYHQNGYPQPAVATWVTPEDTQRFPYFFSFLGAPEQYAVDGIVGLLKYLNEQGKIGKRVAMPYVDAEFALDFVKPLRPALQQAGFEIVFDQGYPMEISDMQSIVTEISRLEPDAVVGITYPNDTMLYVPPMKVLGYNPPLLFLANGPNYYFFYGTYGDDVEGVMGLGGIDVRNQQLVDFYKRFAAFKGQEADRWGGHVYYIVGQAIQQALERVGKVDRKAIGEELKYGTFDTIMGPVKLTNNVFRGNWLIGQWQRQPDGKLEYVAIMPRDRAGAAPLVPKPNWKS